MNKAKITGHTVLGTVVAAVPFLIQYAPVIGHLVSPHLNTQDKAALSALLSGLTSLLAAMTDTKKAK